MYNILRRIRGKCYVTLWETYGPWVLRSPHAIRPPAAATATATATSGTHEHINSILSVYTIARTVYTIGNSHGGNTRKGIPATFMERECS